MGKNKDIHQFKSIRNSRQHHITNGFYRDWCDQGWRINVLGDELDNIRVLGMTLADGNNEEDLARSSDYQTATRYYPIKTARIKAQVCDQASTLYESDCLENGRLLDIDDFLVTIWNVLDDGLSAYIQYSPTSSVFVYEETAKDFDALLVGLKELLLTERPRIARLVRSKQRWGDR